MRILIFTMLDLKKKIKKNTRRYHYFTPGYQISWWYDLQFLRYRVWQTGIRNHGSFSALLPTPLKTGKIRILKKWKKLLQIYSFYTWYLPKINPINMKFSISATTSFIKCVFTWWLTAKNICFDRLNNFSTIWYR